MAAYEEIQRAELEEQLKNRKDKKPIQQAVQSVEDPLYSVSMKRALKIMERMIVQNADEEKFEDYKYYEDTTEGDVIAARPDSDGQTTDTTSASKGQLLSFTIPHQDEQQWALRDSNPRPQPCEGCALTS